MSNEDRRIGVYICNCNGYYTSRVDGEHIREDSSDFKNVEIARRDEYVCCDRGQELVKDDITKHKLTEIIIAACQAQETKFRKTLEFSSLNSFPVKIVNMGELCKVYKDKNAATKKVTSLIHELIEYERK